MDIVFFVPVITVVIFCAVQFVEMKFVDKKWKPAKVLVRDAVVVLLCSLVANTVFSTLGGSIQGFVDAITDKNTVAPGAPEVYTDVPVF